MQDAGAAGADGVVGTASDLWGGGVSRRRLLGLGAVGAGAAAASIGAVAVGGLPGSRPQEAASALPAAAAPIPFHGVHQAGIATPVQDRMHTVTFDVVATERAALIQMLTEWTVAAERMTRGRTVGGGAIPALDQAPPDDTGEALDLAPSRLTLTVGFGPGLFERGGKDRFGLRSQRPAGLIELPRFAGDQLEEARTGGDIVVQACADDPQVAVHAIRNLVRIGFGTVAVRWAQLGFGKTSSTTPGELTPRNLFGFKDGTNNLAGDDAAGLGRHVWVDAAADRAPDWMDGGTYLVARRIAMRIETWDRTSLVEQEQLIGRTKGEGAPLGGQVERESIRLAELPETSHVRLAHPDANSGHRLLRRGYSFVDGTTGIGRLDAGLFFVAFCRDPRTQYVPVQAKLASNERLAEYLVHTGSGLWAVPPGVPEGGYWGQSLVEA
jgi:deferrochelatase/peroxidase EfeB